jgi:hypothetical protein
MVEMCDLLVEHASDPDRLTTDPVVQAAVSGGSRSWVKRALSNSADRAKARSEPSLSMEWLLVGERTAGK